MQHVLVALQHEKLSSYNLLIFVVSLFGCRGQWRNWRGGKGARRPPPGKLNVKNGSPLGDLI